MQHLLLRQVFISESLTIPDRADPEEKQPTTTADFVQATEAILTITHYRNNANI